MIDYIFNGQAKGYVAKSLIETGGDVHALRPFLGPDGTPYVNRVVQANNQVVMEAVQAHNAIAALRRDQWIEFDRTVQEVTRPRLRAVGDLRGAGLQYVIPNGFGKTVLQDDTMTDITDAEIAMDPMKETLTDRIGFDTRLLPLPIIHKDFWYSNRQLAASANGSEPLNLTHARQAARKVAELAEKLLLGTAGSFKFGGGFVYGYTNFPSRMTATLTLPTDVAWTGNTLVTEVLGMISQLQVAHHHGPYFLYFSPLWKQYLSADYSEAKGDNTLMQRLDAIGDLDIQILDYLTGYQVLLVEKDNSVVEEVIGMEITTVQWDPTPFRTNFKVLAIMVPRLRTDSNGNTGIVHGTAA